MGARRRDPFLLQTDSVATIELKSWKTWDRTEGEVMGLYDGGGPQQDQRRQQEAQQRAAELSAKYGPSDSPPTPKPSPTDPVRNLSRPSESVPVAASGSLPSGDGGSGSAVGVGVLLGVLAVGGRICHR